MSKNLTRKGLALGAIVALGSSLFAGAPAFAGSESAKITLVPNAGTTYTTLIGASYEFKNELDQTITNAGLENKTKSELTFLVSNPSAQSITLDLDGAGASYGNVKALTADTTDMTGSLPAGTGSYTTTAKFIAITMDPASQSVDTADAGANLLKVTSSTDSTDAFSITAQAFIDDNNDGEIGTFELTSPVRTLNFIKASTATVTTTVSSATIGTSTIKGKVVIGNDVNNASLVGQVSIGFFKNSSAVKLVVSGSSVDTTDVQWDSTDSVLTNSTNSTLAATAANGTGNTVTADTYTAKAYFGVARSLIGTESAAVTPVAGTVTSADHTDFLVATADQNVTRASTVSTTVRTGHTGAIAFTSWVANANGQSAVLASTDATIVAVAGVKVKVTLTKGATFTAGHEVTSGGKTLTATSGAVSYETTTSATGAVAVSASSNKGTKGDSYEVKIQVLTDTAGYETGDVTTVTFADATVASIDVPAIVGNGAETSVAKGGSVSLAYDIRDSFGASSAVAGTYRVSVSSGTVTGGGSATGTAPVSGGKATFTFTDNTITATGKYTITAQLQKLNTAGTAYEDVSGINVATVVNVGTAAVSAISVPADATTGLALETKTFVNADFRLDVNSNTYAGVGLTDARKFVVTGTATSSTGAVVPGASVTISAAGLQFVAANAGNNNDATLAIGSITVRTNASGVYSVDAYSQKAGDVSISVTSGSATKAVLAKYSFATTANKDSKLTITGPAAPRPGSSNSYVIALTDKFGNAIKGAETIKVEVSGAGYLTSTPTTVSAVDGKTTVTLVLQPADVGSTTLKATYDVANSDTDVVGSLVVNAASASSAVSAAIAGSTKRFFVSVDGNSSARNVVVKVAGKTFRTLKGSATKKTYVVAAPKGSHKVTVFVGGKLIATKTISVK